MSMQIFFKWIIQSTLEINDNYFQVNIDFIIVLTYDINSLVFKYFIGVLK